MEHCLGFGLALLVDVLGVPGHGSMAGGVVPVGLFELVGDGLGGKPLAVQLQDLGIPAHLLDFVVGSHLQPFKNASIFEL
ncbi:MAG: hypothetical protein C4530_09945 [Desulfobacteraceae bacterium]|nr:MAG: hypothetical protein C4530_09945 [Desulfobacteraceae bacterium]